nr:integrase, catalytic region, zinc finger, CCHC-type, peptidase aspartic, catalytic [Tanacetum cinerariifolium]
MANLSKDIQCAGSDTRPPMLDRTDFTSWQQRIRLYCRGKENGVNILKFFDEGPYQMGTVRETLAESTEGAPPFASSSTQVPSPLADSSSPAEDLIKNLTNTGQGMNPRGGSAAGYGGAQNRVGNVNQGQARSGQARTADDCDAFDYNVDEAPTAQTMFMANLSFVDPVTDEARLSYDSDILSEVPDYELYQDATCAHHEGHVTYDSVQLNHVVDSHADYTIDSNMISYDQYVKDNEVPVVHSDASSVPTDAFMMIYND